MSDQADSSASDNGQNHPDLGSGSSSGASGQDTTDDSGLMDKLTQIFKANFQLTGDKERSNIEKVLEEPTVDGLVQYIKSGKCKNIVVMVGAGISTAAGIPDFRSPGSGLYANLQKYNLPSPESMFDISFFREHPEPFFDLARELFPGKFKPTLSHYFIRLLFDHNLLLRLYTQNIDTLERVAGIPGEKLVEAHGTFHVSHCLKCSKAYNVDWMRDKIFSSDALVPKCEKCGATVKPDIVFFGESLPRRFFQMAEEDFEQCDLLIIIGTSLTVQPFAGLIDTVDAKCPRLLINKTKCGQGSRITRLLGMGPGLEFDSEHNYRDVLILDECDNGCEKLAEALGWGQRLKELTDNAEAKELTASGDQQ